MPSKLKTADDWRRVRRNALPRLYCCSLQGNRFPASTRRTSYTIDPLSASLHYSFRPFSTTLFPPDTARKIVPRSSRFIFPRHFYVVYSSFTDSYCEIERKISLERRNFSGRPRASSVARARFRYAQCSDDPAIFPSAGSIVLAEKRSSLPSIR